MENGSSPNHRPPLQRTPTPTASSTEPETASPPSSPSSLSSPSTPSSPRPPPLPASPLDAQAARPDDLDEWMQEMMAKLRGLEASLGEVDSRLKTTVEEALGDQIQVLNEALGTMERRLNQRLEEILRATEERLDRRLLYCINAQNLSG